MHRRQFSRQISQAALVSSASLAGLPLVTQAQAAAPVAGRDYLVLDTRAPVEAPAGKIEVVEFFWYSCPHCFSFEPQFKIWIQKAPKDVVVRRVPVSFRPDFEPQQRLYYVLEALGKLDSLHGKVFDAIHLEKQLLNTPDLVLAWAEKQGLPRAQVSELYNSFPINLKARKATQLQDAFKVDGVPSLGVAGRYFTSGVLARNMERALQVTDHLIGLSRRSV
jgi:thiol:disulfide interchange protein DsbA